MTTRIRDYIKEREGFEPKAYWDVKQYSIGFGSSLDNQAVINYLQKNGYDLTMLKAGKQEISEDDALNLLDLAINDSQDTLRKVSSNFDRFDEDAQVALTDMMYNIGETSFRGFDNMITAMNYQDFDYDEIANHMMDSNYGRGVVTDRRGNQSVLDGVKQRAQGNETLLRQASLKKKETFDFSPSTEVAQGGDVSSFRTPQNQSGYRVPSSKPDNYTRPYRDLDLNAATHMYAKGQLYRSPSDIPANQVTNELLKVYNQTRETLKRGREQILADSASAQRSAEMGGVMRAIMQNASANNAQYAVSMGKAIVEYEKMKANEAEKEAAVMDYYEGLLEEKRSDPSYAGIDFLPPTSVANEFNDFYMRQVIIHKTLAKLKAEYEDSDYLFAGDVLDLIGYVFGQDLFNAPSMANAEGLDRFKYAFMRGEAQQKRMEDLDINNIPLEELEGVLTSEFERLVDESGSIFMMGENPDNAEAFFNSMLLDDASGRMTENMLYMTFGGMDAGFLGQVIGGKSIQKLVKAYAQNKQLKKMAGNEAEREALERASGDFVDPSLRDIPPVPLKPMDSASALEEIIHHELNMRPKLGDTMYHIERMHGRKDAIIAETINTIAKNEKLPTMNTLTKSVSQAMERAYLFKPQQQTTIGMTKWVSDKIDDSLRFIQNTVDIPYMKAIPEEILEQVGKNVEQDVPKLLDSAGRPKNLLKLTDDELDGEVITSVRFDYQDGRMYLEYDLGNMKGNAFAKRDLGIAERRMEQLGYQKVEPLGTPEDMRVSIKSARPTAQVVGLEDGGYVIRVRKPVTVDDTGNLTFKTDEILNRAGSAILKDYKSVTDETLGRMASVATFHKENLYKQLSKLHKEARKGIRFNKEKQANMDTVLAYSRDKRVWLEPTQLREYYFKNFKRHITEGEEFTYYAEKMFNDINYEIVNRDIYSRMVDEGWISATMLDTLGLMKPRGYDSDEVMDVAIKLIKDLPEDARYVYDSELGKVVRADNEELAEMLAKDEYVIIEFFDKELMNTVYSPKKPFKYAVYPRDGLEMRQLDPYQLNYVAGGRVMYDGVTHFVSQVIKETDELGGKIKYSSSTLAGARTRSEAVNWANSFNKVNDVWRAFKLGAKSEDEMLEVIAREGFGESIEGYENLLKNWRIDPNVELVVREDQELAASTKATDRQLEDIVEGKEVTNFDTLGSDPLMKMLAYEGSRGRRGHYKLRMVDGSDAPMMSPRDATDKLITMSAASGAYDTFKVEAARRFKNTFGGILKPEDQKLNPLRMVVEGRIDETLASTLAQSWSKQLGKEINPADVIKAAKEQQAYINQVLSTPSALDAKVATLTKRLAQRIDYSPTLRKYFEGSSQKAAKFFYQNAKVNPIERLRYLTFDLKLGLFAIPQLMMQAQGATMALMLDPIRGLKAAGLMIPIKTALLFGDRRSAKVIGQMIYKVAGLKSPDEFVGMVDQINRIGFNSFGSAMQFVDGGVTRVATGSVEKLRELGRFPFIQGERISRVTAYNIARQRWLDNMKIDGVGVNPNKFDVDHIEADVWIRAEAERLLFSPLSIDNPAFTKGYGSITFQFWNHNAKILNAMMPKTFGGNKRYSTAEKFRMLLGSLFFYGSGAVPLGAYAYDAFFDVTGIEPTKEQAKLLYDGAIDLALLLASDGEINMEIGRKYGIGGGIEDFFNRIFERGDMTGIFGASLGTGIKMVDRLFVEAEIQQLWEEPNIDKVGAVALKVLAEAMSSAGQLGKIQLAFADNMIYDKEMTPISEITDPEIYAMIATGAQTTGVSNTYRRMGLLINDAQEIKDHAKVLFVLRNRLVRTTDEKEREEIRKAIALFSKSTMSNDRVWNSARQMWDSKGTSSTQIKQRIYTKQVEEPARLRTEGDD